MENQPHAHLLPQRNDTQVERATAFGKEAIGITGSAIVAGVSGYKDIGKGAATTLLFKAGGFSLLVTFVSAVVLMHFQMHQPPAAPRSRCADLSSAVLVSLTGVLLVATNGMFVALMDRDNDTVLVILVLPVVLVLGMLAGADLPPTEGAVTAAAVAQDEAYEEAMKSSAELATFGATAAFAIEGALILGYLKYPSSLDGCGRSPPAQVDLAVASFASTVSVLAMAATALPVRTLFPSARARAVAVAGHLNRGRRPPQPRSSRWPRSSPSSSCSGGSCSPSSRRPSPSRSTSPSWRGRPKAAQTSSTAALRRRRQRHRRGRERGGRRGSGPWRP